MTEFKPGRPGTKEIAEICALADSTTVSEIATRMGRREDVVTAILKKHHAPKGGTRKDIERASRVEARMGLRESDKWRRLQQELDPSERSGFEELYARLMAQFKNDVFETEEMQIFDCVRLELFKSRSLKARRKALDAIVEAEAALERDRSVGGAPAAKRRKESKLDLEEARREERRQMDEFIRLQEEAAKVMKSLKGTRDQRFKEVESSKESVLSMFKQLEQAEVQAREGRLAGLLGMAAAKEYHRLGALHEYADGKSDRPILNAETVTGAFDVRTGNGAGVDRDDPAEPGRVPGHDAAGPVPDLRPAPAPAGAPGPGQEEESRGNQDHRGD